MSDYTKLVRALRCKRDDCEGCDLAFLDKDEGWMCQYAAKDDDAATAIEALQAEVDALVHDNERYIQFNTDLLNTKEVSKDEMDEILEYLRNAPVGPLEPMRIEQLPKRGEIVRCGECKHHLPETERTNPYCNRFHCMKPDDWFCADGEREVQDDS